MAKTWKEWEQPLIELDQGIEKLEELARREPNQLERARIEERVSEFKRRRDNYISVMYSRLGPWEKVLVARSERRPYTLDYVQALFPNWIELSGDRRFGDDHAIVGGPGTFEGTPCMILGHQKGRNIQERQHRNFAMAKPEGYRKAIRLMEMAERFRLPLISFVDTPAADPGVESESRGISEAIAASMLKMFDLTVPSIAIVIGEGGSGGAVGIAASSRVLMQEHAIYSVIPPEGCAAILWRSPERAPQAATALKLTAHHAKEFGLIDEIVEEPFGGAHRDMAAAISLVREALQRNLRELQAQSGAAIKEARYQKFRAMGKFESVLEQQVLSGAK